MKKYMAFDLISLTVIGAIIEWLVIKYGSNAITGVPTIGVSLLIAFVATIRWNYYGLLVIPVIVLASMLGGYMCGTTAFEVMYNWKTYLSVVISMTIVFAINPILYIKFGSKKMTNSVLKTLGLLIIDYFLINFLLYAIYGMIAAGGPLKVHYGSIFYDDEGNVTRAYTVQDCMIYNLLGLALSSVGLLVIRSQGIVCNAKQKFVDDRKNAELDRIDREFRIKESADNEVLGETSESKEEDSAEKQ